MQAIELDPADATLYSNRSLCLLQIGEATGALSDASTCIKMRPEWIKGYYRKGTALMSLKVRSKGIIPLVYCFMSPSGIFISSNLHPRSTKKHVMHSWLGSS
jgi:hypothetical protein